MADVFISYKSERRPAAFHLKEVLDCYFQTKGEEERGIDVVWYDYGLVPGKDFEPHIMRELATAKAVIVLWCSKAVASEWVAKEARAARAAAKYLPCWIEECKLSAEFASADTINLIQWDGAPRSHMLDRLLQNVGRMIEREVAGRHGKLMALDQRWRAYGAPSMAEFAPTEALEEGWGGAANLKATTTSTIAHAQLIDGLLGAPPPVLDGNLLDHWEKARRGDKDSLVVVGHAFSEARGVPKNDNIAARLYELAAEGNHPVAQFNLGILYAQGRGGLPESKAKAVELFRLATAQGYAKAACILGTYHEQGLGGLSRDYAKALELFLFAAERGLMAGQMNAGYLYYNGLGVNQDYTKALHYVRLAADQGDPNAATMLGSFYEEGRGGLIKNDIEAARHYRYGADKGAPVGQLKAGVFYWKGRGGFAQNAREAARLFRLSADQGLDMAQTNLGVMYYRGEGGLPVDVVEARRLWTLAARQGNKVAQQNLAMLDSGRG